MTTDTKREQRWPCPSCNGSGRIKMVNGVRTIEVTCLACKGSGRKKP